MTIEEILGRIAEQSELGIVGRRGQGFLEKCSKS